MTILSKIAFGAWQIGGDITIDGENKGWQSINSSKAIDLLQKAYSMGIKDYDTSASYGDGLSEKLIGKAFDGEKNIAIGTKYGWITENHKQRADFSKENLLKSLEQSLKRLKRDKLAYVLMHSPKPEDITEEAIEALANLKKQGIIEAFGISISLIEPYLQQISTFDIVECLYNPISLQNEAFFKEIKPTKIYARSLFASGLLLKKVTDLNPTFYTDWRKNLPPILWEKAKNFAINNPDIPTRFKNIIETTASIPEIDKCIIGFSDVEQLEVLS